MDTIYDYLKLDHQKVAKLFELYETAPSVRNKLEIIALLNKEITVHAIAEEETFYKVLEQHAESQKEALHGENEHQEIKNKLAVVVALARTNESTDKKVDELKKLIEHHVEDEEGNIFQEAKKVLSDEEAYIIREKMHFLKGELILQLFTSRKKANAPDLTEVTDLI